MDAMRNLDRVKPIGATEVAVAPIPCNLIGPLSYRKIPSLSIAHGRWGPGALS